MKPQQIVIVTQEFDPHADVLIVLLRELGHDPIRLHTADFPLQAQASAHFDGTRWQGTFTTRKHTLVLEEIRSIWWRRPDSYVLSPDLTAEEKRFAAREVDHALQGMWCGLEEQCYWMSFPPAIQKASYKLSQLQQAARLGLQVPPRKRRSGPPDMWQDSLFPTEEAASS